MREVNQHADEALGGGCALSVQSWTPQAKRARERF
jgi:hypothetical protein